MISYYDVQMAKSQINLPKDGTNANAQAREKSAHILLEAASAFRELASRKPDSQVSEVLRGMATEFELTALMA